MMGGDVGFVGLGLAALLVAAAVGLSAWQRLGLETSITWASARACGQLLLVGVGLGLVIDEGRPIALAWIWVGAMVVIAAVTVRHRAAEVPHILRISLVAFAANLVVTIGVLFGLGVFPLEGRTLIPITGMMMGNALAATVLVAQRVVEEFRDKRLEIEGRLSLGLPSAVASRPNLRAALRSAVTPQIERTKAVGVIALPGTMTGLILAGVEPVDAVIVQLVVIWMILASVVLTAAVVGIGVTRQLFTADHRLVPLLRPAGT